MVVRQCARRYRARRRNGARCLRIEISNAERTLDAFVRIGVLAEERRNDNRAIEAAISALCQRGYSAIKAERETDRDNNRSGNPFATFRHSKVDELAIPPLKLRRLWEGGSHFKNHQRRYHIICDACCNFTGGLHFTTASLTQRNLLSVGDGS